MCKEKKPPPAMAIKIIIPIRSTGLSRLFARGTGDRGLYGAVASISWAGTVGRAHSRSERLIGRAMAEKDAIKCNDQAKNDSNGNGGYDHDYNQCFDSSIICAISAGPNFIFSSNAFSLKTAFGGPVKRDPRSQDNISNLDACVTWQPVVYYTQSEYNFREYTKRGRSTTSRSRKWRY